MKKIFRILFWLNIDTALGTVITTLFVAQYLGVDLLWQPVGALLVTMLLIYNFDHLIDTNKLGDKSITGKYFFYRYNKKALIFYEVVLFLLLLGLSWHIPTEILIRGAILALFTVLYFLFLFILLPDQFVIKELVISAVFTLGVFLIPITVADESVLSENLWLLGSQVFLLAITNTFVFAWFEYDRDKEYGQISLAILIGKRAVYLLSIIFLIIFLVTLFISFTQGVNWMYLITLEVMGSVLFLTLIFNKQLAKNNRYRVVAESIFLLPLISLVVGS